MGDPYRNPVGVLLAQPVTFVAPAAEDRHQACGVALTSSANCGASLSMMDARLIPERSTPAASATSACAWEPLAGRCASRGSSGLLCGPHKSRFASAANIARWPAWRLMPSASAISSWLGSVGGSWVSTSFDSNEVEGRWRSTALRLPDSFSYQPQSHTPPANSGAQRSTKAAARSAGWSWRSRTAWCLPQVLRPCRLMLATQASPGVEYVPTRNILPAGAYRARSPAAHTSPSPTRRLPRQRLRVRWR